MFSGGDNLNVNANPAPDFVKDAICGDDTEVHGNMTCAQRVGELRDEGGMCNAVQIFYDSYAPEDRATLPADFQILNAACGFFKFFAE